MRGRLRNFELPTSICQATLNTSMGVSVLSFTRQQ